MAFRELLFGEGFVEALENGRKRITIRHGWRDFEPGELIEAVCAEGDRFILEITSCVVYQLCTVPEKDLRDDGFTDYRDAHSVLQRFYPDLTSRSAVSVIRFKVAARKGVPKGEENGEEQD